MAKKLYFKGKQTELILLNKVRDRETYFFSSKERAEQYLE